MRKDSEDAMKPGQAALIVTYGNTTKKHRPLDRDILVLGRAPSCDVALVSPEVAPVHCLILRFADGWRLRDCSGGRHATRLNGRVVHEEALYDTDVLQIGTFSFEVHLPATRPTPVPGTTPVVEERPPVALVKRLERSRRNLVRLALKMRQRPRQANAMPPTLAELEKQAACLRGLQRDYETLVKEYESRLADLENAEREVCDERAVFERDCTERQTRLEKMEHHLARREAESEARLKLRWEECQERCQQAELTHSRFLQALPAANAEAGAGASIPPELAVLLDRRSQELNHFARYLRRCRQQMREPAPPPVVEEPETTASSEEVIRWQEQCQALQAELAARETASQERQTELGAERDKARLEADASASTIQELQAIGESLRREIQDRDVVLEKLRRQVDQQESEVNLEHSGGYERELHAFRLEIESDRRDLNEQICQLQVRQAEMETASREAELQMSRERAQIARERAELTRLRDEIRMNRERTSREGGLRDRLANIHRLKQELAGATAASSPGDKLTR
jgi:pSer/pThr/pTyr-binding forkhead associated (FHA) protein